MSPEGSGGRLASVRLSLRPHRFLVLLLGLVLVLFVGPAVFASATRYAAWVGIALPLFGVWASSDSRGRLIAGSVLAAISVATSAGIVSGVLGQGSEAGLGATLVFIGFTAFSVFSSVFKSPRVTADLLAGALAGYLLLGLAWALGFGLLESHQPRSFAGPAIDASGHGVSFPDLIYFSYVTMMTIGYGDIAPVTTASRSLVLLAGFTGIAFNTIALAVLVAKYLAHTGQGAPPRATPGDHP